MHLLDNAALTLALALAFGLLAQAVAMRLRIPGLVLLLLVGVLLGPDVANVIRPELLGDSLHTLVGFAVAVILFEGGLGLDLKRLRREQLAIRRLITVGALVTVLSGSLTAHLALGWNWKLSVLFGTLIIVTGPTVVTPLLRRLKVKPSVATILEAEGVLIDAVGAIVAAVALQIVIQPSGVSVVTGALDVALRLGVGAVLGALGGLLIALPLRVRSLIPHGMETVFTLGFVLALFQLSDALVHESGIAAVIVAGIVVRNANTKVERELREFKEQLTVMLIGMLFVLLAADVRVAEVVALGAGALAVVVAVIVLIRPASVLAGTFKTGLDWRKRTFLAWIGPRGIVAAAVASLFVGELDRAGIEGGLSLRALVFLVITATVLWSGFTGGYAASYLGLRRKQHAGWVILGAGKLARTIAKLLGESGDEVVCIETNARAVRAAEAEGIRVIYGNGLQESVLRRAEVDTRAGAMGLTPNENTNMLFIERVSEEARELRLCVALESWDSGVTADMAKKVGAEVLFGGSEDVDRWNQRLEDGKADVSWWTLEQGSDGHEAFTKGEGNAPYLPLVLRTDKALTPVAHDLHLQAGCCVAFAIDSHRSDKATERLRQAGFTPEPSAESPSP